MMIRPKIEHYLKLRVGNNVVSGSDIQKFLEAQDSYIDYLESRIANAVLTDEEIELKYPSYLQEFRDARNNRMRRESAKWARDQIQKLLKG